MTYPTTLIHRVADSIWVRILDVKRFLDAQKDAFTRT
jgi:hypothetical protein